jgi:hypothetical protein
MLMMLVECLQVKYNVLLPFLVVCIETLQEEENFYARGGGNVLSQAKFWMTMMIDDATARQPV